MTLNEILNFIEEGSKLSQDCDKESARTPQYHARLIATKSNENLQMKSLEMELNIVTRDRWLFYSGKAEPLKYKEEEFDLKVLRGDIDIFLNSDKKIQEIKSRIAVQKTKVEALDEALKGCNQRTFLIRSMIDYNKLVQGML